MLKNPPPSDRKGSGPAVDIAGISELLVVEDPVEWYPSFDKVLYCSLDVDLLLLYIMFFIVFEIALARNSLLSLFLVYLIERLLRMVRIDQGV